MRRYPSSYPSSFSFGPGPLSSALKAIIGANVAIFLAQAVFDPALIGLLGLQPRLVVHGWAWQLATYMFLHGGLFHILFNMLALWMFGTELEHVWGTRYFVKFYFVTGIGAGILTVVLSLLPFEFTRPLYGSNIIGASGAIYGILLAYALYFPERQIILVVFPVPAKYAVMIIGAIAFYSSFSDSGRGVANATHLGGLLVGYVFLKGARVHPLAELKYRYLKWKINRVRKKFDVYSGGRNDDWDRHVH
jgi:membrane associated rhomboid family serine protease